MVNRVAVVTIIRSPAVLEGMHLGESGGSVGMVIIGGGGKGQTFNAGLVPGSVTKIRRVETILSLGPRAFTTVPARPEFFNRNINCVVVRSGD
jgi:hypothetical protein